jgi:hypothetical protein
LDFANGADDADGVDGCAPLRSGQGSVAAAVIPDRPGSRAPFSLEADLDADLAEEGRRPAQSSGKRTGGPGLGLG